MSTDVLAEYRLARVLRTLERSRRSPGARALRELHETLQAHGEEAMRALTAVLALGGYVQ